jgi:hypothetical protein
VSIVRSPRPDNGFLMARNDVLRDERLSYRALGLLMHMLSHADGWVFRSIDLARDTHGSGRDAVREMMKELEACGYLHTERRRNADGTFATTTYVYDTPQSWATQEAPKPEVPAPVRAASIEDHHQKTKNTHAPTVDAVFEEFWVTYPRKADKPAARRAWAKVTADPAVVLAGARLYRDDANREDAFTKYPATWLNNEGWNNPPEPARSSRPSGKRTTRMDTVQDLYSKAVAADAATSRKEIPA